MIPKDNLINMAEMNRPDTWQGTTQQINPYTHKLSSVRQIAHDAGGREEEAVERRGNGNVIIRRLRRRKSTAARAIRLQISQRETH